MLWDIAMVIVEYLMIFFYVAIIAIGTYAAEKIYPGSAFVALVALLYLGSDLLQGLTRR